MSPLDPYAVAEVLGRALEALGVPYYLGGSLASSLPGEPRSTNDVDMVVELSLGLAERLAANLGEDFEVDVEDLKAAVRLRRSTQLYFLQSFTKVDLYICGESDLDRDSMRRRRRFTLLSGATLWISSPEDTIVRKLYWYRLGQEVSDRQWRDVLGMLRVGRGDLDRTYLVRAAELAGIADLLAEAERDVGP
ncbi:MAG: hypothetical protein HY901_05065 [Deltaproteobacteria bacterium]|nr:hypothetical protein [Deltaproteobacteria bacterium]